MAETFKTGTRELIRKAGVLYVATSSVTVAETVTETSIIGATGFGNLTLPVNLLRVGTVIRVTASGVFGTEGVSSGSMRFLVKLGSTTILDSVAHTPAGGLTDRGFSLTGTLICRTTGGSGTVFGQGVVLLSTAAATGIIIDMETTAAVTVSTVATQAVGVTFTWGTSNAANTLTCTNVVVEVLN